MNPTTATLRTDLRQCNILLFPCSIHRLYPRQNVFLSLIMLFFLLTIRDLTGSTEMSIITGYEGTICWLGAVHSISRSAKRSLRKNSFTHIPKEQAIGTTQTFPFKIADARAQHFCYVFYMFKRESLYAQFRIR